MAFIPYQMGNAMKVILFMECVRGQENINLVIKVNTEENDTKMKCMEKEI